MASVMYESRIFNQRLGEAKKAALKDHVVVTNHGKKTHLLVGIEDNECDELLAVIDNFRRRKAKQKKNLFDLLGSPETAHMEFQPEKLGDIANDVNLEND